MAERKSLFDRLRQARRLFEREAERGLEGFGRQADPSIVVQHVVWVVKVEVAGDVHVDLRDDHGAHADHSVTGGTHVHGDVVVHEGLREAAEAARRHAAQGGSIELSQRLDALQALVADLVARLPPDAAQAAARDLGSFAREATSRVPRPTFCEITAHGLLQAAKSVAHLAVPIAEAVAAVLELLK